MQKIDQQLDIARGLMQSGLPGAAQMDQTEIDNYLQPFLASGQLVIGTAKRGDDTEHFGFALWAKVSDETDAALKAGRIDVRESGLAGLEAGENAWIVDLVCPVALADAFLTSTTAAIFPDKLVMASLRDKDGDARCIIAQQTPN